MSVTSSFNRTGRTSTTSLCRTRCSRPCSRTGQARPTSCRHSVTRSRFGYFSVAMSSLKCTRSRSSYQTKRREDSMTPPHGPGHEPNQHESDEIVDMTPYSPEGELEEILDMTPTRTLAAEAQEEEEVDMTPAYPLEGEPERALATTPPHIPPRQPAHQQETSWASWLRVGKNRWKLVMVVIAGLVVVALVGRVLGQSAGGAVDLTGGGTTSPATSTPKNVQIGNNNHITTAPGPLILLNPGVVRQRASGGA